MKNNRGKGAAGLVILLAALIGFVYLAYISLVQNKITLGLDLARSTNCSRESELIPMKRRYIRKERTGSILTSPAFLTQTAFWRSWDSPVPLCSLNRTARSS